MMGHMSLEAVATVATVAFLAWAWYTVRRRPTRVEREAERSAPHPHPLRNPLNGPTPYEEKLSRITSGMNSTAQSRRTVK